MTQGSAVSTRSLLSLCGGEAKWRTIEEVVKGGAGYVLRTWRETHATFAFRFWH